MERFTDKDFRVSTMCDLGKPSPQCVQVACKDGAVAVRSSKSGNEPTLLFDNDEWAAFVQGVKNGEFDV